MRSIRALLIAGLLALLAVPAAAAAARQAPVPPRFVGGNLDTGLTTVVDPVTGVVWAAWSYRDHGDWAIALCPRDARGRWGETSFVGLDDGRDQLQPALATDRRGNLYLAFAERQTGLIRLAVRPAAMGTWSVPAAVTPPRVRAFSPALHVVGNRLILAYAALRQVKILEFFTYQPTGVGTKGIQDGPDGFPIPSTQVHGDPIDDGSEQSGVQPDVPQTFGVPPVG